MMNTASVASGAREGVLRVVLPKRLDLMTKREKRQCRCGLDELSTAIVNGDECLKMRIARQYGFELDVE